MTIPIPIIIYVLRKKKINQLKLYLFLKYAASGHIKLTNETIEQITKELGWMSTKTFKANLNWLARKKWLTYNSKTKNCRIASYNKLQRKIPFFTSSAVDFILNDLNQFRPFIYATVITWCMKYKFSKEKQPGRIKGRSRKSCCQQMYELPNRYLAKVLELDHSTISKYKSAAIKAGYLTVHKQYLDMELPDTFIYALRYSFPDEAHLFVVHNGKSFRQKPDLITSTIILKRKRLRVQDKSPPKIRGSVRRMADEGVSSNPAN